MRQGLLTNVLNPKMGAFYGALLPQFIRETASRAVWEFALAGVHVLIGTAWLTLLALVAQRFKRWLPSCLSTGSFGAGWLRVIMVRESSLAM